MRNFCDSCILYTFYINNPGDEMLAVLIMAKTEKKYLRLQLGVFCFVYSRNLLTKSVGRNGQSSSNT